MSNLSGFTADQIKATNPTSHWYLDIDGTDVRVSTEYLGRVVSLLAPKRIPVKLQETEHGVPIRTAFYVAFKRHGGTYLKEMSLDEWNNVPGLFDRSPRSPLPHR